MFTNDLEKLIPEMRGYARMLCGNRDLADDIVDAGGCRLHLLSLHII